MKAGNRVSLAGAALLGLALLLLPGCIALGAWKLWQYTRAKVRAA